MGSELGGRRLRRRLGDRVAGGRDRIPELVAVVVRLRGGAAFLVRQERPPLVEGDRRPLDLGLPGDQGRRGVNAGPVVLPDGEDLSGPGRGGQVGGQLGGVRRVVVGADDVHVRRGQARGRRGSKPGGRRPVLHQGVRGHALDVGGDGVGPRCSGVVDLVAGGPDGDRRVSPVGDAGVDVDVVEQAADVRLKVRDEGGVRVELGLVGLLGPVVVGVEGVRRRGGGARRGHVDVGDPRRAGRRGPVVDEVPLSAVVEAVHVDEGDVEPDAVPGGGGHGVVHRLEGGDVVGPQPGHQGVGLAVAEVDPEGVCPHDGQAERLGGGHGVVDAVMGRVGRVVRPVPDPVVEAEVVHVDPGGPPRLPGQLQRSPGPGDPRSGAGDRRLRP